MVWGRNEALCFLLYLRWSYMATQKRTKSKKYPGVYFRDDDSGKERTYYIRYRIGGREAKQIEEPVGKASVGMTEAKANQVRIDRMRGKELSNTEKRRCLEEKKNFYNPEQLLPNFGSIMLQ